MMSVIGMSVLLRDRHVHARHQREMERHMAFVAVAEIVRGVLRPLVGFGEQHAVGIAGVERGADLLDDACVSGRFSQFVPSRSIR